MKSSHQNAAGTATAATTTTTSGSVPMDCHVITSNASPTIDVPLLPSRISFFNLLAVPNPITSELCAKFFVSLHREPVWWVRRAGVPCEQQLPGEHQPLEHAVLLVRADFVLPASVSQVGAGEEIQLATWDA